MTEGLSGTVRRWAGNPARQVLAVALVVGVAMAFAQYAVEDQLLIAGFSEEAYLDHMVRTRGKDRAPGGEEILLVQFDEDTFRALDTPYQQLTPHLVKLVEILRQGEAKAIGMDMGFASFRESGDHEAFLATCQQRDDVVFTSEIQVGKAVPMLTQPVQTMIERARPPLGFANLHLGDPAFVSQVNRGKVVRLVPVHHASAGTPWSFAVEVARRARKLKAGEVAANDTELRLGERSVPLERGMLRVDYRGSKLFGAIAAENLIAGKLPPRIVKGRVVLVGSNWRGLGDFHQTPFGEQNGLRVQAAAAYTLLAGRPPVPVPAAVGRGVAIAVAALVGLAFMWWPRWAALAAALTLALALHAGTLAAFQAGRWFPNFFAVVAAPVTGILLWGLDLRRRPEVRLQRVVQSVAGVTPSVAIPPIPDATMPGGAPPPRPESTDGDIVLRIAREVVAGRYEAATLLGRGGMGVVLRAYDPRRDQHVAVKILSPLLCDRPQLIARFMREIKALQQLEHPGVVRILDVGDSVSTPYYAMELIDGRDLKQVMKDGPFELERARDIFAQLLEVLAHIHAHGVIHRDLKPDNVLLQPGDKVKLLDFGLAHIPEASTLTQDGEVMGTLRYMSPEQMEGVELTPASDVFSIALVIFEAMTGKMPFPEIGRVLHHSGTITGAASMRADVPLAVSTLLMRAVSPVPGNRPADAAAFARAWHEAWS